MFILSHACALVIHYLLGAIIGLQPGSQSDEEVDVCVVILEPVMEMQPIAFDLNLVLTVQTCKDLSHVSTGYTSVFFLIQL